MYKYVEADLPDVATLKDVKLQTPMQVYSADGELIAQFGEKRRIPLTLSQIPPMVRNAFIATEDSRFYDHHGIDPIGIFRAASVAMTSGRASQGASTITQQLARNFFLSPEKTVIRKVKEAFLAIRIEQLLTKDEILELYLNKIYLGQRAYGVGAAAYVYFGKSLEQLTLSEIAVIAGLPKAPSTFNPLYSKSRALARRNVVLTRMLEENYITRAQYDEARNEPIEARYHAPEIDFSAPYLAEMVRMAMIEKYGENAYTDGYKVYTTVKRKDQLSAEEAVHNGIIDYDMRHGYRGAQQVLWPQNSAAWDTEQILSKLKTLQVYGPLNPGVVLNADANRAQVMLKDGSTIDLTMDSMRWARKFISDRAMGPAPRAVNGVVHAGEQIWVRQNKDRWMLAQIPDVNSALVALNPADGAVIALVGGFDFELSKFNRVTQSLRQVGSSIKPLLYTAALDKGLTLASLLNDLPIVRADGAGPDWRPKNSPPRYDGPIRLRQGLGQSKNVVMVRAMRAMGVNYAADYLLRFGFPDSNIVRTESMALGSSSFTPMQMVRGYAVMTNGGYLVDPYFISRIDNTDGTALFTAEPKIACPQCTNIPVIYGEGSHDLESSLNKDALETDVATSDSQPQENDQPAAPEADLEKAPQAGSDSPYAPHVVSTQVAFLIKDAMNSNIYGEPGWSGTGWRAMRDIKRRDLGGKTGTTNSSKDAWFVGYGPDIVAAVWIGFDENARDLGRGEAGAKSAQPIWNDFMKVALEGVPERKDPPPPGIISVQINRSTGKLGSGANSRSEYFIKGTEPTDYGVSEVGTTIIQQDGGSEELF